MPIANYFGSRHVLIGVFGPAIGFALLAWMALFPLKQEVYYIAPLLAFAIFLFWFVMEHYGTKIFKRKI